MTTKCHCSKLDFCKGAYNQAVTPGITRPLHATGCNPNLRVIFLFTFYSSCRSLSSQFDAIATLSFVMCEGNFERTAFSLSRFCSTAVAATCDTLSITSLVARKLLGTSFSLVRKCAGKQLLQFGLARLSSFIWLSFLNLIALWCDLLLMNCLSSAVGFTKSLVRNLTSSSVVVQ